MSLTLKRLVAWNLMFGAVLVFGWIVYGALAGLPINVYCMGFHTSHRSFNAPAWLTPALIEAAFLIAFLVATTFRNEKSASLSACSAPGRWSLP